MEFPPLHVRLRARDRSSLEKGPNDTVVDERDTIASPAPTQDGLSLFFFARDRLPYRQKVNVPAIVREQGRNTYIDFVGERTSVEIDAVDYPVDVLRFEGNAGVHRDLRAHGGLRGVVQQRRRPRPDPGEDEGDHRERDVELMQWNRAGMDPAQGEGVEPACRSSRITASCPTIHPSAFVAEGAWVIGEVSLGELSRGLVQRRAPGRHQPISVGARSQRPGRRVLHVTRLLPVSDRGRRHGGAHGDAPRLRDRDRSLIGMSAVVLDGARVGPRAIVAAGAVVREGFVVPEGSSWPACRREWSGR